MHNIPDIPGIDGRILNLYHSINYQGQKDFAAKKAKNRSAATSQARQNRGRNLENRGKKQNKKRGEFAAKYNVIAVLTKIQILNTDKESNLP